jgi:hypothetical protein
MVVELLIKMCEQREALRAPARLGQKSFQTFRTFVEKEYISNIIQGQ